MFEINQDESFSAREERILSFWNSHKIFLKSIENRKDSPLFSVYDGPPFATGLPHYGHLLASAIKDTVFRYQTMRGYKVPRRFGWDCHGLPVENEIEKAKELSGAGEIEAFGIADFNEECRKIVLRYTKEWQDTIERFGRWVDFSKTWKTMDTSFMESVWWVFKQLYEKGLVYEGFKVMPFSAKLGTPLSNFEANLNYQDVDDPSVTVRFEILDQPGTYLLAWTTTPWTLISNLALAVGPFVEYVKIETSKKEGTYILAKDRLSAYFKEKDEYTILDTFTGENLNGMRYKPLFPHFEDKDEHAFRVLNDEFVSTEDGTGIVHMAPAFGEVDFFACQKAGIEIVCPVDSNGKFTDEVPEYEGQFVKDADSSIIRELKKQHHVFDHSTIRHRYPFCWRSDTPLIYKAVSTWFIAVEKIKDEMIAANQEIHWVPNHLQKGRFGKWLDNARDWAISRNRYWGTPIPIWRSDDGEIRVIGSMDELHAKTGSKTQDLHRHFIDDLTFEEDGKIFKRVHEVFDCWFESGSMPYASVHYPFENKEEMKEGFPCDFIAEGLDQTRGWFYTLLVLSTALFKKPAFKNVIVNGIILAEDGNKMSKRLKNYPEPGLVINQYGADAVRLYMMHSGAVRAEDLSFSEKGVQLVLRQFMIPLWNSYSFLATYATIYKWKPSKSVKKPSISIDRWILSRLHRLMQEVEAAMDQYQLSQAVEPFTEFINQLTNWYIRRSRSRFWSDKDTEDRRSAFSTLYTVLVELSKVAAPFIPFMSDAIYQNLRSVKDPTSVHLTDYPKHSHELRDIDLEEEMEYVQTVVSLGHALRKEHKLKVRQPLSRAYVVSGSKKMLKALENQKNLIADELNVKDVVFEPNESKFVELSIKPNFRVLGKKVGKLMPKVQKEVQALPIETIKKLEKGKNVEILVDGQSIELTNEDVAIARSVKEGLAASNNGDITVALDTKLNEELEIEALAREIVNKINTMRRDQNFAVTDRIYITFETTDRVKIAYKNHKQYIDSEVLATKVTFGSCEGQNWDLNGEAASIYIERTEDLNTIKSEPSLDPS